MTKITLGKMSNPAFTKGMELLLKQKLPVKTAFRIKTLTNKFNEELKKFAELRVQILEFHCAKKEDGTPDLDENRNFKFDNETVAKVTKEINDLLSIEVEFEPIKIDELGDISLSGEDLLSLGEVIDA